MYIQEGVVDEGKSVSKWQFTCHKTAKGIESC